MHEERYYGKAEDLFLGIQGEHDSYTGEGNPQRFAHQSGLACNQEPAVYLDTAAPRTRRSQCSAVYRWSCYYTLLDVRYTALRLLGE